MSVRSPRVLAAAAAAAFVLSFADDADACSGPLLYVCRGTTAIARPTDPPTLELRAAASGVGPNFTLLFSTAPPTVTVTDKDGANVDVGVAAHPEGSGRWILTPSSPLVVGATYKVAWQTSCETEGASAPETTGEAEVTALAPAAPPSALGTITVKGPVKRSFVRSSCDNVNYSGDEVVAQIELTPDASFAPWRDSVGFTMLFDGKPPPPNPRWSSTWSDSFGWLRASCSSPDATGITPAVHEITFTATVPGSATPLTATATIDFSCANAPTSLGGSSGGSSGSPSDPTTPSESSCSMATPSTSSLTAPALLLLASSLAFARSRGRSRSGRRS